MTRSLLMALSALALLSTTPALALPGTPPLPTTSHQASQKTGGAHAWSCSEDEETFCAKVDRKKPGAIRECLDRNKSQLSSRCSTMRDRMYQAVREWQAACGKDMKSLCGNVKPGDFRGREACLQKNERRLSEACKAERKRLQRKADARLKPTTAGAKPAIHKAKPSAKPQPNASPTPTPTPTPTP